MVKPDPTRVDPPACPSRGGRRQPPSRAEDACVTRSPAMSLRALAGARVPQRDGGSRIGLRRQSSRASPSLVAALASQSAAAWRLQLRDLARAAHGALHAWQLALALS